jgi:hypothetical protein
MIDWIEQAAKQVLQTSGHHVPQIMIVNEEDQIEMMLIPFMNDEVKEKAMSLFREIIQKRKINEYFIVLEGWKTTIKPNQELPKIRPRDDPNRTECLIIAQYKRDLTTKTIMIEFSHKDGKIVFGERTETTNKDNHFDRWNFYLEDSNEKWDEVKKWK